MKLLVGVLLGVSVLFGMVDINHADIEKLSTLQGIGKSKASKIVEYRKANGCFSDKMQLIKVKGIGKAILAKNKKNIIIKPCK
jgi:competence protein ComEA